MSSRPTATPQRNPGRAPAQERQGLTRTGARKVASQPPRSRARSFALQALYQYLLGGGDVAAVDAFTRDLAGFARADEAHYKTLLHGCAAQGQALDALLAPRLDRPMGEVSPIERICLWIGCYELQHCPDVPAAVVINECVELGKAFGGTDGHKYVNAVLGALVPTLRPHDPQQPPLD